MGDYTAPLTLIDERDAGFIGIDMLNKTNVSPINPAKGWLVLWQEGHRDKNGNGVATSVCNVSILGKEAVVDEILKYRTKYGLSKEFEIIKNVLEHPKVWRIRIEALKSYKLNNPKMIKRRTNNL